MTFLILAHILYKTSYFSLSAAISFDNNDDAQKIEGI